MPAILSFDAYNDTTADWFFIVFQDDGSAVQVKASDPLNPTMQVAPPGTFSPNQPYPQMVSAGLSNENVVCIIDSTGYFIWDGTNLFQQGTASPVVDIIDGGHNYTSAPTVTVFGGSGSSTAVTAQIDLGSVSEITVTNPGMGYLATDSAILIFTGGGQGTSAYGVGNTADGVVTSITVVSGGAGYTAVPTLTITPVGGGSGAVAVVSAISGGVITGVQVLDGGSGYDAGVTISDSGPKSMPAIYRATIEDGVITSVTMFNVGSGYSSPPEVRYISTSGSGAGGTPVLVNGTITGVAFDYPSQGGSGYQTPPLVQFVGGGGPASATLELMPFGVVGNAIETYQSRIWIADGNRIFFTAPGSLVDFGNGGGVFQVIDSNLQFSFKKLIQSNGFLYLIGDSAVYYISGVSTSAVSTTNPTPVTTFSFLNVDPQIGTPWPQSVQVMGRRIVFGNANGVYAIVGGAVEKVSDIVDNLFYNMVHYSTTKPVGGGGEFYPSAMIVTLYAKPCYALLLPLIDQTVGGTAFTLLMWDGQPDREAPKGRWWTATQSLALTFINGVENLSTLYGYGTDGQTLNQLFHAPSTGINKVVQSRLWMTPSIIMQKKTWGVYALFECYDQTALTFETDTETGIFPVSQGAFLGNGTGPLPSPVWARSGASAPAGQVIGFTMTSDSPDFALMNVVLVAEDWSLKT
jgi:hypothetical protein